MTLKNLLESGNLSMRTYNFCRANGLNTYQDLQDYYQKYQSFKRLRNCGEKSNEELINICENRKDFLEEKKIPEESISEEIINKLSELQIEIINFFIINQSNRLSIRSKNAISRFLEGNLSLSNICKRIFFNHNFKFYIIQNVGEKSIEEIKIYITDVKNFIKETCQLNDKKHLRIHKNQFLFEGLFLNKKIPEEILESDSIFYITNYFINNCIIFKQDHTEIIKKSLKIFQNKKEYTLEEISIEKKLSRERIRQIRNNCLDKLHEKLLFVNKINDDLYRKYSLDVSSNYIEVSNEIVFSVNSSNKINFSREFISYLLSVYLSENFCLLGNSENLLLPKTSNTNVAYNWENYFLVNKKIINDFNFSLFINDFNNKINTLIENTYVLDFRNYLNKFITNSNFEIVEIVFPIAAELINKEFGTNLVNGNVTFYKNKFNQAYEYAYEALQNIGKPSNLKEIFAKIIELHPNYKTDKDKIKRSMNSKFGFITTGRDGLFGLENWPNDFNDFKGGSIRSIATEFLEQFDSPKHISLVFKYVSKYRKDTYERSIRDNLIADSSKSFIFFPQGFIGIMSKKANYNIEKYTSLPSQLGKTIISLDRKGSSKTEIMTCLKEVYGLDIEESKCIIENLEYFKKEC